MATRQIRARTGQLEDPLPEGKKLEEKEFPKITPVHRDGDDGPGGEMSKDDILAHKEELKNMQKKDAKHGGEPNSLSKHGGDVKSMANTMSGREPKMG